MFHWFTPPDHTLSTAVTNGVMTTPRSRPPHTCRGRTVVPKATRTTNGRRAPAARGSGLPVPNTVPSPTGKRETIPRVFTLRPRDRHRRLCTTGVPERGHLPAEPPTPVRTCPVSPELLERLPPFFVLGYLSQRDKDYSGWRNYF